MRSSNGNFQFIHFTEANIDSFCSKRDGEKKLGEEIQTAISQKSKYVLIGIEESIGPQANGGFSGAEKGFKAFLERFVNMQSNRFMDGSSIVIAGSIQQNCEFTSINTARTIIEELDDFVVEMITPYLEKGLFPIVIGGGHNNAFPIIQAVSKLHNEPIHVVNLDPHADCRALEGRHSGNGFSYAKHKQFLDHYTVIGLHKQYNSEFLLNYLDKNNFGYTFFDDYLMDRKFFYKDLSLISLKSNKKIPLGIELDLDSISNMPSSAFTPSGFSVEEARTYIKTFAALSNCAYLHLPEGAPKNDDQAKTVGKTLAYLTWDFINEHSKNIL